MATEQEEEPQAKEGGIAAEGEGAARSLDAGAVIGVSLTFGSAAASNMGRTTDDDE